MSNPPVPPVNPEQPSSGEEQPRFGERTPQQGQPQQPQYGAPQQGQPQYGQQSQPGQPQYGAPQQPQFGQQSQQPQHGAPSAPQYGAPQQSQHGAPQYGTPSAPQYGAGQQNQYGAPQQYGQPGQQAAWPSAATSGAATGTKGPVPQKVNLAFWLIIAAGVLSLIGAIVAGASANTAAGREALANQMGAQGDPETINSVLSAVAPMLIVFGIIGLGLYVLVAFFVRKGANWARILGTVFAVLSLSYLGSGLIYILSMVLGIAAIVLIWLKDSAPWFRKQQPYTTNFSNPYGQ
ncbi:hypothetical protein ACQQCD_09345 [Pseudarthrobacter sp. J1763]|uniref:hypothetical protein n=1 Tax=Pseudarthrobacter sp. J1763 TaxID=3420445 RepID=UPI003D2B4482